MLPHLTVWFDLTKECLGNGLSPTVLRLAVLRWSEHTEPGAVDAWFLQILRDCIRFGGQGYPLELVETQFDYYLWEFDGDRGLSESMARQFADLFWDYRLNQWNAVARALGAFCGYKKGETAFSKPSVPPHTRVVPLPLVAAVALLNDNTSVDTNAWSMPGPIDCYAVRLPRTYEWRFWCCATEAGIYASSNCPLFIGALPTKLEDPTVRDTTEFWLNKLYPHLR